MAKRGSWTSLDTIQRSVRGIALALALKAGVASAATLTVNTTADDTTSDANLTLREAVLLVNNGGDANAALGRTLAAGEYAQIAGGFGAGDTILFDPALTAGGDATLYLGIVGNSKAGPSALGITSDVTISGPTGDNGITIARDGGAGDLRLFFVDSGASLSLNNLTLAGGIAQGGAGASRSAGGGGGGGAAGMGGAIFNAGTLQLEKCTVTGNTAVGGAGGYGGYGGQLSGAGGGGLGGAGGLGGNGSTYGGGGGGGVAGPGGNASASGGSGGPNELGVQAGANANGPAGGGGGGGNLNNNGGTGGFGGGGGGGGNGGSGGAGTNGIPGASRFGGGSGSKGNTAALRSAGGGAGMGGGIFNYGGTAAITNSTISGNSVQAGAGGITGLEGQGLGGGIFNRNGTVSLNGATVASNSAADGGGGIFNVGDGAAGTVVLYNTIVADSASAATDLETTTINGGTEALSGGNNLIENPAGHTLTNGTNGNIVGADPVLNGLADNGGPTFTHLPMEGSSPALDASSSGPADDQRGNIRPQNGSFDIGSVEIGDAVGGTGFLVKRLRLTSNWRVPNRDRAILSALLDNPGAIPAPGTPYPFDGAAVTIFIGGQKFSFTLDARGKDTLDNGRFLRVRYAPRTNQLRVLLKSPYGSYQFNWFDEGMTNVSAHGTPINVFSTILIDSTQVQGSIPLRYSNRVDFSGKATGKGIVSNQ